jgi:hypothetical protein
MNAGSTGFIRRRSSAVQCEIRLSRDELLEFVAFGAVAGGLTDVAFGCEFTFLQVAQDPSAS